MDLGHIDEAFRELADWKTKMGMPAKVVLIEDIKSHYQGCDTQEKMREFIKDAHRRWGTEYVLLGGDVNIVPCRMIPYGYEHPYMPSDLYYSAIMKGQNDYSDNWNADGDHKFAETNSPHNSNMPPDYPDFNPDIAVGRAPVGNLNEVNLFLDKNFTYYRCSNATNLSDPGYLGTQLNMGGIVYDGSWQYGTLLGLYYKYQVWLLDDSTDQYNLMEFKDPHPASWDPAYDIMDEDLRLSTAVTQLNVGYGIINHLDHSGQYGLGVGFRTEPKEAVSISYIWGLTNGNKYGVFYSAGCETAPFDVNDCIGEKWILAPNGGGVAYVGTATSILTRQGNPHDLSFFNSIYNDKIHSIGFTIIHANMANPNDPQYDPDYLSRIYQLLADPHLSIFTEAPQQLSVTHPSIINNSNIDFEITVSGVPNGLQALVCVKKDNQEYAYVETGNGTVTFNITPNTPGEMTVTVTAPNCAPYEGTVTIDITPDIHLFIDNYQVKDNKAGRIYGNDDGKLDAGEKIGLFLTVKNEGYSNAEDVTLTASCISNEITFIKDHINFGDISQGHSVTSDDTILFQISTAMPDLEITSIDFAIHAATEDFTDNLFFEFHAPILSQIKNQILDGGDGIQPDENIGILTELGNYGSGNSENTRVTLSSTSPYVSSINDPFKNYGTIDKLSSKTNEDDFNFTASSGYQGETIWLDYSIVDDYNKQWNLNFNLDKLNPPNLTQFVNSYESIGVIWMPINDPDLLGYNVYRSNYETGNYTQLNTFPITGTSYYQDNYLSPYTDYYYKVTAVNKSGNESDFSNVLHTWTTIPQLSGGWSIAPDVHGKFIFGSSNVIDINDDGQKEIFVCSFEGESGYILGWHADGREIFDIDNDSATVSGFANLNATAWSTPALGDIDNDAIIDIVVSTRDYGTNQKTVFAYKTVDGDGDGMPDLLWTRVLNGPTLRGAVLSDLDGDGYLEIVVPTENGGNFYVLDHNGNDFAGSWPKINISSGYGMPAVADLDGDGYKEIIMGFTSGVYIWRYDGSDFTSNPFFTHGNEWFVSPPVVVDLDNDGDYEILVLSSHSGSTNGKLYGLELDGSLMNTWTGSNTIPLGSEYRPPSIAVGDMDMDMDVEVVVGGYGHLKIWDNEGNLLQDIAVSGLDVWDGAPVLADIDCDPGIEIIVSSQDGYVYGYNLDGSKARGFPLKTDFHIDGTPSISDVDNDGDIEIVVGSYDSYTYIWDTEGSSNKIEWSSYRNNPQNTGVYAKHALFGSLPENSQITWSGTIDIIGDILLPDNSVLTILPGTEIIFEDGDIEASGEDPNKSELIIKGELVAQGQSTSNRVVFTSNTADGWYGIVAKPDGELNLEYCKIEKAERGIEIKPAGLLYANHQISYCEINNCNYGIYISSNSANIQNSQIHDNSTGIYLYESQFSIYNNNIYSNSKEGIYLSNSSEGEIIDNYIYSNNLYDQEEPTGGIVFYQSSPALYGNQIVGNSANGLEILDKSYPVILESNLISNNGPTIEMEEPAWEKAEILMHDISNPYMYYGHNDVVDNRSNSGYLMIHTGEQFDEIVQAQANYWGGGSPEQRLYPIQNYNYEDWDEEPNTEGGAEQMSAEEQLFVASFQAEKQGDFNSAKNGYQQIISTYPDSIETAYSLARLLICERKLNGDLSQLQAYYLNFSQSGCDSINAKIAESLARRCLVKQLLLNDAIVEYENVVQNPPSLADSVYAVIDIGDIYLLQEQLGSGGMNLGKGMIGGSVAAPRLIALKPESAEKFEVKKNELFALLFGKKNNEDINKPKYYALSQNYPNPFNPATTIKYQLPKSTKVKLDIFNILGQKVKTLVDARQPADYYVLKWDGKNDHGKQVGSGLYIYRLIAEATDGSENFVKVKKMLLIR